jgi:hypothetical protein
VQDFSWWSGLTATDAKTDLEMVKSLLAQETIDRKTYWMSWYTPTLKIGSPSVYLLPAFDEYTVAYKDRSALFNVI